MNDDEEFSQDSSFKEQCTAEEYTIFQNAITMARFMGGFVGPYCEVVVHSLKNLEKSVVFIVNGHISGRKRGAPITDLALELNKRWEGKEVSEIEPHVYKNYNKKGQLMRSTTIPLSTGESEIIGFLCINLNLEMPLSSLGNFFSQQEEGQASLMQESLFESKEELLNQMVRKTIEEIRGDATVSSQTKNKSIVLQLAKRGFFEVKGSVALLAEVLGVSTDTIYLHLRERTK